MVVHLLLLWLFLLPRFQFAPRVRARAAARWWWWWSLKVAAAAAAEGVSVSVTVTTEGTTRGVVVVTICMVAETEETSGTRAKREHGKNNMVMGIILTAATL
ncbi:hypothetical protein B0T20DRAFT_420465, partial [Sordaria brevicollis]